MNVIIFKPIKCVQLHTLHVVVEYHFILLK